VPVRKNAKRRSEFNKPVLRERRMLWLKAFHIIFMVTWFAGLFYLPRLFIYHCQTSDAVSGERFEIMERRLMAIMTIGATLTAACGMAMLSRAPSLASAGWLHAKLTLVGLLIAHHYWCYRIMRELRANAPRYSQRWLRWFNEVPAVLLIGIVVLAVVKPF
jgi:protoporphyrinogen IX oxidase